MNKTVLLVEDDPDLLELLEMEFELANIPFKSAPEGETAFDILKQGGIDFVFSDVKMPKMTGLQLLENIREANIKVPVLLFSGQADLTKKEVRLLGAIDIISKPINVPDTIQIISKELENL